MNDKSSRRQFIDRSVRIAGFVGIGVTAGVLAKRASGDYVYQVDPLKCTACDRCRTSCVLSHSAVKAVNDFSKCGYCMLCPAYFDVTSFPDEKGTPTGRTCPQDALKRRVVGKEDPDDPNNNYYEYVIDEERCDGCGKCVKACKPPAGNGSLRLEIRYARCVECNECSIKVICPDQAIVRVKTPGMAPMENSDETKVL
jgi:Na+-translocating ferredoxin:NAD+ oxidoreductase subunit B